MCLLGCYQLGWMWWWRLKRTGYRQRTSHSRICARNQWLRRFAGLIVFILRSTWIELINDWR